MHKNLFEGGHSRAEIKMGLLNDQKRDGRRLWLLDLMLVVCVVYLIRDFPDWDRTAVILAVLAAVMGMRNFIDQSVRNFYLHRLDWENSNPDASKN
ncbi:MAG: hypothetical protein O9286_15320 [Aquidulcibacter sp.]|uniref:hypothetical protein n=1 Tax=Aquidulcibacter sp. TaxID=2052990 RepID=UPI0022C82E95|nr:hypothetical protein [Aquidulcibacter sp.]